MSEPSWRDEPTAYIDPGPTMTSDGTVIMEDRAEAHRQDVETIRGLRAAMQAASKTLKCPAAEYVPAMSEAWGILDDALAQSFKPHHART